MKIVKDLYDNLLQTKLNLEEEIRSLMELRERVSKDGDLSENADYIKACSDLEQRNIDYQRIMKLVDNGYPVPVSTEFNIIDIGSKFHLKVSIDTGDTDEDAETIKVGVHDIKSTGRQLILESDVIIAGDIEDYVIDGYISSECTNARALIGKPVGTYTCTNADGEQLILEASYV